MSTGRFVYPDGAVYGKLCCHTSSYVDGPPALCCVPRVLCPCFVKVAADCWMFSPLRSSIYLFHKPAIQLLSLYRIWWNAKCARRYFQADVCLPFMFYIDVDLLQFALRLARSSLLRSVDSCPLCYLSRGRVQGIERCEGSARLW